MIEIISETVIALQGEARSYPENVQIWMKIMAISFLLSIFFVYKKSGARWILLAFVVNVIGLIAGKILFPEATRTTIGSIVHITFWTPILWVVWCPAKRPSLSLTQNNNLHRVYVVWLCWTSLILAISLVFDLRALLQM